MKFKSIIFLIAILILSCNKNHKEYDNYGAFITNKKVLNNKDATLALNKIAVGDTTSLKLKGKVVSVCKKKGCWVKMTTADQKEVMVRFKDYGFFVPKDIEDKEIIIEGNAFVEVLSKEEQEHYAKDGGTPNKAISDKETYAFVASGVLIEK